MKEVLFFTDKIEFRAAEDGSPGVAVGYPVIFDSLSRLMYGEFKEVVRRGAFDNWLNDPNNDVRADFDHNDSMILGRRSAGTLKLAVEERGVRAEIMLPDTVAGRDVAVLLRRGDIRHMSFGFIPKSVRWGRDDGVDVREIHEAELHSISPIANPAYLGTEIALRSYQEFKRSGQNPLPVADSEGSSVEREIAERERRWKERFDRLNPKG